MLHLFDAEKLGILFGLAIGDGYISCRERFNKDRYGVPKYGYITAELAIGHGPAQEAYINHKADLLAVALQEGRPKIKQVTSRNRRVGKDYPGLRLAKTSTVFREMHPMLYALRDGQQVKVIGRPVLDMLTERSIALWFMDDGSMRGNKNKVGEVTSLFAEITTQIARREEAELIADWFNARWGLPAKLQRNKGKFDIGFRTPACLGLAALIRPYLAPGMEYKLRYADAFVFRPSIRHPNHRILLPTERTVQIEPGATIKATDPLPSQLPLDFT